MSIAYDILPECFVDTNIVNTFLTMEGVYVDANHCHGCNKVGNMMMQKLKDFTEITKDAKAKDSKNLRKLFKDMVDDEEMMILKNVLGYIYKNKYKCDEKILSGFFSMQWIISFADRWLLIFNF